MMTVNGCYNFNKKYIAVDITLDCSADEIDWFGFSVPEPDVDAFKSAAPHMEQFFSPDGRVRLCDTWDEPDEDVRPVRTVFFIRKTSGTCLETPYGSIDISSPADIPADLKVLLDFEPE